jgi:Protein of unknown function (DUF3626)
MGSAPAARSAAQRAVAHVAARSSGGPVGAELRVTLNFHPDRLFGDLLVLEAIGRDGVYRSQFETGTSNGGLTAYPGGARWGWESRMFGGAYDHAPAADRPRYGSLNFRRFAVGGSPRFGSSHLRLRPETLARTTFCYPDSFMEPTSFGVASAMSLIDLAAAADPGDALDGFRGTRVQEAASRLGCAVEWHGGFTLGTAELARHPDYRGARYVRLGIEIAVDERLDPRIIGDAARTGRHDGQDLKRVWHYVARFGAPG